MNSCLFSIALTFVSPIISGRKGLETLMHVSSYISSSGEVLLFSVIYTKA